MPDLPCPSPPIIPVIGWNLKCQKLSEWCPCTVKLRTSHLAFGPWGRWEFSFYSNCQWEFWFVSLLSGASGSTKGQRGHILLSHPRHSPAVIPANGTRGKALCRRLGHHLCFPLLQVTASRLCWLPLSLSPSRVAGAWLFRWEFAFPWSGVLLCLSPPAHCPQHPEKTQPGIWPFPWPPWPPHRAQASYLRMTARAPLSG